MGISRNTHKKGKIELPRKEFLETIVPEHIDRNGNLEIKADLLRQSLENNMTTALSKIPRGLLVKNYYLGMSGSETSIIYFRQY